MKRVGIAVLVVAALAGGCASQRGEARGQAGTGPSTRPAGRVVDFRYPPPIWQTAICLPDDPVKTLVSRDGRLCYDFQRRPNREFHTDVRLEAGAGAAWVSQALASPRVPHVTTVRRAGDVEVRETSFATTRGPRADVVIVELKNTGAAEATVRPELVVRSTFDVTVSPSRREATVAGAEGREPKHVVCSEAFEEGERRGDERVLQLARATLPPGRSKRLTYSVFHGGPPGAGAADLTSAERLRADASAFWEKADLPYGRIEVPDSGMQALLDSSVRNIYQAREIKEGLPAFQVGPTVYRGLWVVDGSFLMESVAMLGREQEARQGIRYLLKRQQPDGGFELIPGHWKETGIVLWAVTRHARLTGDKVWLAEVWPSVVRGYEYIRQMRTRAATRPSDPNYRLTPAGFPDGGLGDREPEYTNAVWTLAGLHAAVDAARWLGKADQASAWEKEYDDFYATFRRAAERDARTDAHGNRYLPVLMQNGTRVPPQKAQWAFLHAVFPGKIFPPGDPLVAGTLEMLRATEVEGIVQDTGWLQGGLWNYFASFYGHALLWVGEHERATDSLYAMANHASPLLVWREEHLPQGRGAEWVGDMPHNWASAEFIRLVRHCLVMERGNELHLFEALPPEWVRPGGTLCLRGVATEFGPISLEVRASADGRTADVAITPPTRTPPGKIVLHLNGWSARTGVREFSGTRTIRQRIPLQP